MRHRWKKDEFRSLQVGIGGSMVWHRWKYGGWCGVVIIQQAKSKSFQLLTLDLTFRLVFGLDLDFRLTIARKVTLSNSLKASRNSAVCIWSKSSMSYMMKSHLCVVLLLCC